MIPSILLVAVLGALAVASLVWLPPLHPAQLWTIPWTVAASLYLIRLLPYRRLSVTTAVIAAVCSAVFVAASLLGERLGSNVRLNGVHWTRVPFDVRLIRWAASAALCLTGLLLCGFLLQAGSEYGVRAALIPTPAVRAAIGAGHFAITIKFVYAALSATVLCAMVAADGRAHSRRWACGGILAIATIYFATGRATIIDASIIGCVAYLLTRRARLTKRRYIGGVAVIFLLAFAVFVVGGRLIGKTYANNSYIQATPSTFTRHPSVRVLALPYEYASAPVAALDAQVASTSILGTSHGCAVFSDLCRVLRKVGLSRNIEPVPRVRPFTLPPLPWNTYTGLDVPLMDGGFIFVVPIVGMLGCAMGLFWRAARQRTYVGISAYSVLSVAVVTSAGSFNYTAPYLIGAILISLMLVEGRRIVHIAGGTPLEPRRTMNTNLS